MFRRLSALLWSRKEILLANKQSALMLFMPVIIIALYSFMFKDMMGASEMIFSLVLPMIPIMIGYILPTLVSEEAEKHNQQTLILSGVKVWEYITSSLIIPLSLISIYLLALPFALGISIRNWPAYLGVNIVTGLVLVLLYMAVALACDTQAKASIVAMPIMMMGMLLPMMSRTSEGMAKLTSYSFMGAYSAWDKTGSDYQLTDKSFLVLLLWLVLAAVTTLYVTKKKQVKN
ncbi:ABC transporter permease [Streptococcus plurextorum]|uniref:ABC transporter permease n=1 Tax=Streptococcus plurextorum TaxID=456876 RepID=UPI00041A3B12|nr:ABC transporter permease [Streptococcus plurextorum]